MVQDMRVKVIKRVKTEIEKIKKALDQAEATKLKKKT